MLSPTGNIYIHKHMLPGASEAVSANPRIDIKEHLLIGSFGLKLHMVGP